MATQVRTKPTKFIPDVKESPFVGSLLVHQKDRLNFYLHVAHKYGEVARFHFGNFPALQVTSPKFVHGVLVEHAYDFDKGELMHNAFRPIIGNGLFISEGDFHRRQRKLMAPSFQPRQIMHYADTMVRYGEQIQQGWQEGAVVDIGHEMTRLTMSIVGKALFDADVFTEADELGGAMTLLLQHTSYALSHLFPIPLSWPTPHNWRVKRALTVMDHRIQRMIDERAASSAERNDFLSILLQAREEDGSRMSQRQVRDEALTLFGAGHETTATALTWTWYLLTSHPAIYQRMMDEIDNVLQGRSPGYADLAHLPYTLQVFKEAMRLYPPAYAVSRVALHDIEDIEGYNVRRGETVLVAIYAMHRRSDYFPEPEKFDPERFVPEREKQLPRYAYMPFGAGPRICIGNHFALMEGHLLLATLAQRVAFERIDAQAVKPDPSRSVTIRPDRNMQMRVRRRATQQ
ncbi:cytochrome P450 [Ktedonosporobacter rubrisoli]|uniref:Cytochrome P450 n=1 Tax=Ktedonosporobacter rubrisoli TaxID=2509675 RepID=A0A4P6K3U2_KTERU|nr:cytochrome P450 [Ktedonosporobacter rubrisoli]QBD82166.1 cytochrome P450 [Ktedonosporobacter rubrisoli]